MACRVQPDFVGAPARFVLVLCMAMLTESFAEKAKSNDGGRIFCFSMAMPFSGEPDLLAKQYELGSGLFSCDGYKIFSNASFPVKRFSAAPEVVALNSTLQSVKGGKWNTWLNWPSFFKAWHNIVEEGTYKQYDWIVKLDPDAVFFPERFRQLSTTMCQQDPCEPLWVANCGPELVGSIEVFSKAAIEKYAANFQSCKGVVDQEDQHIQHCMEKLGVASVAKSTLIADWACGSVKKWGFTNLLKLLPMPLAMSFCDADRVAYHPLKTPGKWFWCWWWAKGAVLSVQQREQVALIIILSCMICCLCAARFMVGRLRATGKEPPPAE